MQNKWRLLRGTWQDRGTNTSSALLESRVVLQRRFEVMERHATETEEKAAIRGLGKASNLYEWLYEKLEWPRKEIERQFVGLE